MMKKRQISRLIDETTADYFLKLGSLSNDNVHDDEDVKYIITDKWQSRVFLANYNDSDADAEIKKIVSYYDGLEPPILWYVSPNTCPENLERHLESNSFVYQGNWKAMATDLTIHRRYKLPEDMFRVVEDPDGMMEWTEVLVKSFQFDEKLSNLYTEYFTRIPLENSKIKYYMGFSDCKPVASAALYAGKNAAGVFYLSTIPEAREKGIGTGMMYHLIDESKNLGYKEMILQASSLGYPIYKRIGFEKYHTTKIYKRISNK